MGSPALNSTASTVRLIGFGSSVAECVSTATLAKRRLEATRRQAASRSGVREASVLVRTYDAAGNAAALAVQPHRRLLADPLLL